MKKLFLLPMLCLLFLVMSSFSSTEVLDEDFSTCWVTLTYTNMNTGESHTETYYSNSRTSGADCAAGAQALANGDFMNSSDFRRSPVLAPAF
ncbi:hypothetical protein [Psychroserpens damuponensis]|uniref:hypothetical protein n=1 Tax=Psychroserpens damuponensis TaxID=943936 RepID=UPI00058F267F|nr:hypothetical protein [Psychroserpens damuponensis]